MGLAEKDAPAPGALSMKSIEKDSSSLLPVSSVSGVLDATEKTKGDAVVLTPTPASIDATKNGDVGDLASWRGRHDATVGQDPLAAAASAASTMISETAHRAAELTLGAVAPGTTTEDLVRASKEGIFGAFTAARAFATSAVAAAAASASEVSAAAVSAAAAASSAVEAARVNNGSSSSAPSVDDYAPADGATVLGAFSCEFHDRISSSSNFLPQASRKIRGALYVTSTSAVFVVSRAQHQAFGRAVARAVAASAAEASASASAAGTAGTELAGFLGASMAAEDAYKAAKEAEKAAGLPAAGTEVAIQLGEIGAVRVDDNVDGGNALVISTKEGKEGGSKAVFASFGAPSDADEALALLEHVRAEGK